jgi:hypothetical protein
MFDEAPLTERLYRQSQLVTDWANGLDDTTLLARGENELTDAT